MQYMVEECAELTGGEGKVRVTVRHIWREVSGGIGSAWTESKPVGTAVLLEALLVVLTGRRMR